MIQVGFKSDKGIRRYNNEDAFYVMPEENLFVVADGVGGARAGEIASRTAVNLVADYVRSNKIPEAASDVDLRRYFMDCVSKANTVIYETAQKHVENRDMATTMVITYLRGNRAYVVNIGDSRAYLYRDGALSQITEDHTYVNELVQKGRITREEARYHEKRNRITRAVGGEELVFPDFFQFAVRPGDIIMLCTDGLYGEVSDEDMAAIIEKEETMSATCTNLVKKANRHGGGDNITVICLKIGEEKSI